MSRDPSPLNEKVDELLRAAEGLDQRLRELEWRIGVLAVSKVPAPRFPYWNWLLRMGISEERKDLLQYTLSALDSRTRGEPWPEEFRKKEVAGVSNDLLFGVGPRPPVAEFIEAIRVVAGLDNKALVLEMIVALNGQSGFKSLCAFILDS